MTQWFRTAKNREVSSWLFAHSITRTAQCSLTHSRGRERLDFSKQPCFVPLCMRRFLAIFILSCWKSLNDVSLRVVQGKASERRSRAEKTRAKQTKQRVAPEPLSPSLNAMKSEHRISINLCIDLNRKPLVSAKTLGEDKKKIIKMRCC